MAQPVSLRLSMARAISQPSWLKSAGGLTSGTSIPLFSSLAGAMRTRNSERVRLPLSCRPGPCWGSDESVRTSSFTAANPFAGSFAVKVYVSLSGRFPPQRYEPSAICVNSVPASDFASSLDSACQSTLSGRTPSSQAAWATARPLRSSALNGSPPLSSIFLRFCHSARWVELLTGRSARPTPAKTAWNR